MKVHASHKTRMSDASTFDEICEACGATDTRGSGKLHLPCPAGPDQYDEDYYLRGRETGKSLYRDYRWLPEMTIPMVQCIAAHLGITHDHTVLDFGCARGYVVKAFRQLAYRAWGVDTSEWAIANCDPDVRDFLATYSPVMLADWVIAKDVLEHVVDLKATVNKLMDAAQVGLFIVVPLSPCDGEKYVIAEYEKDITHIHRMALPTWAGMFMRPSWVVEASYRVSGVKQHWYRPGWEKGNGFITARRVK